jgi:hypothetical protein
LKRPLKDRKIAFLLDELGACKASQVLEIVECFHSLAERAPGNLKLVVTLRESPSPFLPNCRVKNPKHKETWTVIRLASLTVDEVRLLISFFPSEIALLLCERVERICELTDFKPQAVKRLWDTITSPAVVGKVTEAFIDEYLAIGGLNRW